MMRNSIGWRAYVGLGFALFAALAVVTHCTGCAPATRAEARGAVLATAEAVKVGDEACAKYALATIDVNLARSCEAAYTDARLFLLTASSGVDAWDEGKRNDVTCAIVHSAEALSRISEEMRRRKLKVPVIIDDSLRLIAALGGCTR